MAINLGSNKGGYKRGSDGKLIPNESVQSKLNESSIARSKSPALTQAQQQQAFNLVKNFASGGATFGQTVAGFKSLSEEVKPPLEERGENVRKRVDPVVSEMQSDVPGVTINSQPGTKSNVDALAGKPTASEKRLRKVISGGNPKAINQVLREELKAAEPAIKQATNEASNAVQDPKVQEQLKSIGIEGESLTEFNNLLDNQGVNSLMQNVETEKVADVLSQSSQLQMKALGNPFGFDLGAIAQGLTSQASGVSVPSAEAPQKSVPGFGPKGLPFGNLLGSVVGAITNTGSFQGVGTPLDTLPGGINPDDGLPVLPTVDAGGNTNLAKVVNKGNKLTDVTEPSTPVYDTTNSGGRRPIFVSDLRYEKVNGAKELILEMNSVDELRSFDALTIGWVAKSGTDDNWTAREWNNYWLQAQRKKGRITETQISEGLVQLRRSWQCNYFVRKDGTVERVLPIDMIPYSGNTIGGETFVSKCAITLDAGLTVPRSEAGGELAFLSADSITAEQWRSLDMILKAFFKLPKAQRAIGLQELAGDVKYGPGFDVDDYIKKFRRQVPHQSTVKKTPAAEVEAEIVPSNPRISYDKDKRQYAVNIGGVTEYYDTEPEAEAALAKEWEDITFPNGNKVSRSTLVRGEWDVFFLQAPGGGSRRNSYSSKEAALAAAESNTL